MKDLDVASASTSVVVAQVKNGIKPADETGNGEFFFFLQKTLFIDLT